MPGLKRAMPFPSIVVGYRRVFPLQRMNFWKESLNQHLVPHPLATFFVRVSGDSMIGAGIHEGDLLIVGRSLEARDGRVVIAVVNGELLVKRLKFRGKQPYLVAEHPDYPTLYITEAMDFQIWGVVTNVIHPL